MKMPRSQCESENVQFVQELAEVDGPFESPININFRDLTKLELPPLVWNRGDTYPKKMKITNTGHTVILSGKWKCERPYLTGGPLAGKYVFSQIHFHWGQDDCRGSEHLVCGNGFPLEMHVAHFKTEYLTQECALREKDGMVVVVYLFKLQEEPNQSLKKIINLLPAVKQPSTSHTVDPRPILSFCNPFTDDYFMYWGSVVTSTCAHILLWIICREPFGISREQINEFRKIMDSSQQPICRNSRDIQPLHRRNVFHVNASKHLDDPLLPVKTNLGCYCRESGETAEFHKDQDCKCQEECEGGIVEFAAENDCLYSGAGVGPVHLEVGLPSGCFHHNQTYIVQRATVHSVSVELKRFDSEPVGDHNRPTRQFERENPNQSKFIAKSCCFFPLNEYNNIKPEKRKTRGKRPFNSGRAFSQILHSLEALKNHTFRKLKEIESINQEIKGMKSYCRDNEDRRWLRKIEKMMKRQRRFTIKSSQGCLSELRRLARDCNLDKIFDCKALECKINDKNGKLIWLYNNETTKGNSRVKPMESTKKESSKQLTVGKAIKVSAKAQRLIQSFFEDIQDTDEFHETVKKDLNLKKIKSFCSKEAGDSNSMTSVIKGYITQNMFESGNLGDRFFTEVTTDDFENDDEKWENNKSLLSKDIEAGENIESCADEKIKQEEEKDEDADKTIPDEKVLKLIDSIPLSKSSAQPTGTVDYEYLCHVSNEEKSVFDQQILSDEELTPRRENKKLENLYMKLLCDRTRRNHPRRNKLIRITEASYEERWKEKKLSVHHSSSNLSTESTETQGMIIGKICRKSRKDLWERNTSDQEKSYESLERKSCKEIEGYITKIQKKNHKTKKRKKQKGGRMKQSGSSSREASKVTISKWKNLTKAKFKLEIEKTSKSFMDLAFENSIISSNRKKLKLESQKGSSRMPRVCDQIYGADQQNHMPLSREHTSVEKDREVSNLSEKNILSKQTIESPNSENEWKDTNRTTVSRTLRPSSADSKISYRESKYIEVYNLKNKILNSHVPKPTETKTSVRSRSLTRINTAPRISEEIAQRYVESRRNNNKEISDLRRQLEIPKKPEESCQVKADLSRGTLTENCDSDREQKQREPAQPPENKEIQYSNKIEYNVGFFTTASNQVDEELLPKSQAQEIKPKNPILKRCDAEKYQFLEKGTLEFNPSFQDRNEVYSEVSHPTDSNVSFTKNAFKGDANDQNINNKDLQTTLSYLMLKKSSPSRPHSAETLNSRTKTFKQKGKKRPHCCKRISRHYIRKNSSIFKKPNKTESKPLNFLSLTDQEQLKIISVNVAKYLKQKLIEESERLAPKKTSVNNLQETVFTKLTVTEEKKEEEPPKETAVKEEKVRQNRIPALKTKEKKKEKLARTESITKTKSLNSPKEAKNDKPVCHLPKPVNNFIKLNKLMAGKYKKVTPSPETIKESKQKQNLCPERAKKEETVKFKTRIPRKREEKKPCEKMQEQTKIRPTPVSLKNQKRSPTRIPNRESRTESPVTSSKAVVKSKKPPKEVSPPKYVEESKELVACDQTSQENVVSSIELHKAPSGKKHLIPAYSLASYPPTPIGIVESQKRTVNRYLLGLSNPGLDNYLPEVLCDKTGKRLMEGNEALFKKELEYFIKLEMLDISTNLEKSMNYVKSTLSQDYFWPNVVENNSVEDPVSLEPYNKEIVLLQMKDVECKSSSSDFVEDSEKYSSERDLIDNLDKNIFTVKIPKESGDPGIINSTIARERQEETHSDSSYDCKISITLNTNFSTENGSKEALKQEKTETEEGESEVYGYDFQDENSQAVSCQEKSSSQSLIGKHRRKRKENEISLEMKHKLLEILEGEIRREIGIKSGSSSENSRHGLTIKWEDSDGNNRSLSTGSSCDNIEVLTQISDTMRQYLKNLKEQGRLVEIINESSDKDS